MKLGYVAVVLAAGLWVWVLLTGTGCDALNGDTDTSVVSVSLAAIDSSGETGTATLTGLSDGTTQVAITTAGGNDTGVQSAVIRSGPCGTSGTLYAVLNNLQGRQSITTLPSTLATLSGSNYVIEVNSSTSVNDVVTCGAIP